MNVAFVFKKMYEPGENAPPQFTREDGTVKQMSYIPSYSDKVTWKGYEYFVYHINHKITEGYTSDNDVVVVCTRKVFNNG